MNGHSGSPQDAHICILGLGLMGASLAMALRGTCRITAIDIDPGTCEAALRGGIADEAGPDLATAAAADIVIVATPMRTLIRQIGELGAILEPGALLMDLGSVKAPVVAAMNALPDRIAAVAGHPLCGREVSGIGNASPEMFRGARFVLCPTDRTTPEARRSAVDLVRMVGAIPVEMPADRHDRAVSAVSGLPHVLAAVSALVAGSAAQDDAELWKLATSGFRDTSRLAASDPSMVRDLLLTNAEAVLRSVAQAQAQLDEIAARIQSGDGEALLGLLAAARSHRRTWEERRQGK